MTIFSSGLNRLAAAFVCAALLALSVPAAAQWGSGTTGGEYRPRISTAEEIAITQRALSVDPPSATEWARHSKEYKEANDFDREAVMEAKRREYIEKFRVFTKPDVLVISANVQISRYSEMNKGFVIESFNEQTFFGYSFGGENYAVVIPKLMDYQWVEIEPEAAQAITSAAGSNHRKVNVVIEVEPKYADKKIIELGGKPYRILAGEVATISIYAPRSDRVLWSRNGPGRATRARSDMMDLFTGK